MCSYALFWRWEWCTIIRPILENELLLRKPSDIATPHDLPVAKDLLDTFRAHADECVGMAANMIGVFKRIIIFDDGGVATIMLNPEIISTFGEYETSEGCLSLKGKRPAVRYRRIRVRFQDLKMTEHSKSYTGFTAQVIQHEIDHCDGIVI